MQAKRALHVESQYLRIERLLTKIVSPHSNCLNRVGAILVTSDYDHFGVGRQPQDLLKRGEAFGRPVRIRRQTQIEGYHGWLVSSQLNERAFAIAHDHRFVRIEAPAHL